MLALQILFMLSAVSFALPMTNVDTLVTHDQFRAPVAPIMNPDSQEALANESIMLIDERNMSVSQFIKSIYLDNRRSAHNREAAWKARHPKGVFHDPYPLMKDEAFFIDEWRVEEYVEAPLRYNHANSSFDLQKLDWERTIGMASNVVQKLRDLQHQPFFNLKDRSGADFDALPQTLFGAYFDPQSMLNKSNQRANSPAFQLRNQFAVKDHLSHIYSNGSKVWKEYNWNSERYCLMNFSDLSNSNIFTDPVKITTLALSNDNPRSLCMIGGLNGEYAFKTILADNEDLASIAPTAGHATNHFHGSINHIDVDPYHTRFHNMHAVLSCNDHKIRVLDLETGLFLHNPGQAASTNGTATGHLYPWPINCTASSPDGRLRVLVGDSPDVAIVNADTGRCERLLKGHDDFGFACAWSPDSRFVATTNQDRLCNVYDTRTWKPVSTFNAHVTCFRSMKFSPVGGGSRCLLLAEEADRVHVVEARSFQQAQVHTFYGEVHGIDFNRDGSGFWIANGDDKFGGFMSYKRKGYGQRRGQGFRRRSPIEAAGDHYMAEGPDEWIREEERRGDRRCADPYRDGAAGNWVSDLFTDLNMQI